MPIEARAVSAIGAMPVRIPEGANDVKHLACVLDTSALACVQSQYQDLSDNFKRKVVIRVRGSRFTILEVILFGKSVAEERTGNPATNPDCDRRKFFSDPEVCVWTTGLHTPKEQTWHPVLKQFQEFGDQMECTDAYTFYRLEHELAHYLRIKSPHWEETELEGVRHGAVDLRCFRHLTENLHRHAMFQLHRGVL